MRTCSVMASHPYVRGRGSTARGATNPVIVFAPDEVVARWISEELAGQPLSIQRAPYVKLLVAELVDLHPPRPQIAIVDFDALTAAEVFHLHAIREHGWFGTLIALGRASEELQASLNIERVLRRPFGTAALRKAVRDVGLDRPTARVRRLDR